MSAVPHDWATFLPFLHPHLLQIEIDCEQGVDPEENRRSTIPAMFYVLSNVKILLFK